MGRKRQVRWIWVLAIVLLLHGVLVWGLMRQMPSNPPFSPETGQMVQAQLSAPASSSVNDAAKQAESINNHSKESDFQPAKTSPNHPMLNSATHVLSLPSGAAEVSASDTQSSSVVPASENASSNQSQSSTNGAASSGVSGSVGSSSGGGVGGSGGNAGSDGTGTGAAVDCLATQPANTAAAGLDVAVWVERTSGGARFVSLVNQAGEGAHYLREIKAAAAHVRFVAHDPSCVGKKVKVRVRVVL